MGNAGKTSFGAEVATALLSPRDNAFLLLDFREKVDPVEWAKAHKELLLRLLLDHGVVFFRNMGIPQPRLMDMIHELVPRESLADSYQGGVTGRPRVDQNLFLTTTIPGGAAILQHHEMSYLGNFPKKLFFACKTPAEHGGATPVTFSRRVKKDLDPALFEEFKRRGLCYIRNYFADASDRWNVMISWQRAFGVSSKAELMKLAEKSEFSFEWVNENQLRTRNRRPAVITHPATAEEFIFNHSFVLHFYSEKNDSSPAIRGSSATWAPDERQKVMELEPMDRPYLVTWGDNLEIIPNEVIEELFEVYNRNKVVTSWCPGDLMMIDNILASHGRDQFMGKREHFAILSSH